jgi:hypothetical protein
MNTSIIILLQNKYYIYYTIAIFITVIIYYITILYNNIKPLNFISFVHEEQHQQNIIKFF